MTTTMPPERIAKLTGYKRPSDQIRALHAAGYWLSTLTPAGVSLPMEHYRAVCAGAVRQVAPAQSAGPQMRPHPWHMTPNTEVQRPA